MEIGAAAGTAALESNLRVQRCAARRATHDLSKSRHVDIARSILRNPPRAGWGARLTGWSSGLRLGLPVSIVVLVPAQAVLAFAHECLVMWRVHR